MTALVVAALGLPMAWALLLVMATPAVTIVGYEAVGTGTSRGSSRRTRRAVTSRA